MVNVMHSLYSLLDSTLIPGHTRSLIFTLLMQIDLAMSLERAKSVCYIQDQLITFLSDSNPCSFFLLSGRPSY